MQAFLLTQHIFVLLLIERNRVGIQPQKFLVLLDKQTLQKAHRSHPEKWLSFYLVIPANSP